ncbi:DUF3618 domain-containing protein [Baekduia soli]|uniref:DUF3618 domain-containing protein n=1 Tax=Baekduia soli TaxID=496014 RepID=A0A5B8UBE8_9ACTN|nr:DUF3618 domain-containing protein [Baekduia soli]QEC50324.1 DUF3618 domain-containing protein [Baekduia soli]
MTDTRTSDQIRRDIEHTRSELAETAAALADKADVKARAHERLDETKARITGRVGIARARVAGTAGEARGKAVEATPASVAGGAQDVAGALQTKVRANPVPVALALGLAFGVFFGRRRGA